MASVTLDTVWINGKDDAGNWLDVFRFSKLAQLTRADEDNVELTTLADGSILATVRPGRTLTWRLAAPTCTLDELAWLQAHQSQHLCFRDFRGQKIYGIYSRIDDDVPVGLDRSSVSLTVTEIPLDEAI